MNPLVSVLIQELPDVITWVKSLHAREFPDAPGLTDEQAIAALAEAVKSSVEKDDRWHAAHPED